MERFNLKIKSHRDFIKMAVEDNKIISTPDLGYIAHPGGVGCTFFEKMWEHHDKIAQIDAVTGIEETYVSLLQRCVRTAITMRSKGIKQDDMISICSSTNMDICVPYIASLFLGAKPSTSDSTFTLQDTIHLLQQIKPKMIFVSPELVENMEKALKEASLIDTEIIVFGNTLNHTPFEDFLHFHPEEDDFKPVPVKGLKDTAVVAFSNNNSGLPKVVCLSHYGLILTCHQTGQLLHMTRTLSFSSFLCISTINLLVTSVLYGSCRVVVPKFNPNEFWQFLSTYKPTTIFLATNYIKNIIEIGRPGSLKLNLKIIMLSGRGISKEDMQTFQEMVPEAPVVLGYAQTELNGLATFFDVKNPKELAWSKKKFPSTGTVLPGFSMKIIDTDTKEPLGPNQKGELRVKSSIVMNGYYNLDSSNAWDAEGWLKTGDLAYYDEDYCFYIIEQSRTI